MQGPMRIAIDGPAGSGKSTIGERLAQRLGYLYVDTGAMYRALAWLALRENVDVTDGASLEALACHADIVIGRPEVADGRQYTVTVQGKDVTWDIRNAEVTCAVSAVSKHPAVRAILQRWQREIAQEGHIVMVGRDIGAVVLPNAELKIYLTASLEERARRRQVELMEHMEKQVSLQDVMNDIHRRDELDHDNMQPAVDAIVLTTDHLSVQQVLEIIYGYYRKGCV